MNDMELMEWAKKASEHSYSPYSSFKVGAALLCENQEVILGCNVENRSFGLTNCAERTAIFSALSKGIRSFKSIAIFSPDSEDFLPPCGACRQVLSEFVPTDFPVLLSNGKEIKKVSLGELFPMDSLHDLKGNEA